MISNLFRSPAAILAGVLLSWSGPRLLAQAIPQGDIVVDLAPFAVLPNSGNNAAARTNVLRPAPDGRIFVNDQRGQLYTVSADGALVTPFLNLAQYTAFTGGDGEIGFQSFAFHPDFNQPGTPGYGKFYTMASQSDTSAQATFTPGVAGAGRNHDEVLLEWTTANPGANTFAPANAAAPFREVLRIARPNSNHNAGYISFNPMAARSPDRGNLYIGTGDSGGGGDPLGLAQALGNAYGAILRINPLAPVPGDPQASANGRYSIPADNPHYAGLPAFLPEKYAAGFRNPQRFTWDSGRGTLFIADIGQNVVEEIDIGVLGANYGWAQREGSYIYSGGNIGANARDDADSTGFTYPVAEYFHYSGNGNAVTTGPVYRGSTVPQLNGRLIFSDFVNGVPYTLNADYPGNGGQDPITELRLRSGGVEMSFLAMIQQVSPGATRADLRFGADADNNVYFLNKQDGVIRRVVPVAQASPVVQVGASGPAISRSLEQWGVVFFTRSGDLTAPLTVKYKLLGTAVAGQDYFPLSGSKRFAPGNRTATLLIRPKANGGNGTVRIALKRHPRYGTDPAVKAAVIRIEK